jgi:RNA polymerase sigma-B factor
VALKLFDETSESPRRVSELHAEYVRTRDPDLRSRLVETHLGLAEALAARFTNRVEQRDDIRQVALIGLLHAVDRFDPDRGVQFATFAWSTITGEIKRYFRDRSWGLRVPRRLQELFLEVAQTVEELTHLMGRSPTIPQIAARIGVPEEDVIEALEVRSAQSVGSLDTSLDADDDTAMQIGAIDPAMETAESTHVLSELLHRLPDRDQVIIRLRFAEDLTQSEIATRIGISQMQVSRILARSLAQLREWGTALTPN